MFTAENEDVLVEFANLCRQYPNESAVTLWEQAGGHETGKDELPPITITTNPVKTVAG